MKPIYISFLACFLFSGQVISNNISISNISITGQDISAGVNNSANFSLIKFDVSWENSWRSASLNWDAAWIFVKYRVNGGVWNHCNLNNTGHTAPLGSTINAGLINPASAFNITTNPAVGAFIYRSSDGSGSVNYQNVYLRWNYGSQGVQDADVLDIQVFAIEMVNVPTGTFAVGDGVVDSFNYNSNRFTLTTINTGSATTVPSGTGSLGGQAGGYPTGQTAPTNSSWPNGFNGFYCMKYEITQGLYRDFLNTLTYTQQVGRTSAQGITTARFMALYTGSNVQYRNGIEVKTAGNATNNTPAIFGCDFDGNNSYDSDYDGEWIACNFLSTGDVLALLDWSALRPMSEMEYEKACRGPIAPVQREYAWGTNLRNDAGLSGGDFGQTTEALNVNYSNAAGTGNYVGGLSPFRVGNLASNSSNTGRITSGGTYYGIMEMTGNIGEICVNILNFSFIGTHGDGTINTLGVCTNSDWWISSASSFNSKSIPVNSIYKLEISDRSINYAYSEFQRNYYGGGRGVRSTQ
ncbi:MAG: formylglycine-generating enzyme family protein [Bacteroidetes bacterium]|nr:formylglycine-generating enzyme family protein [Bacteroidota bacterium]